MIEVTPKQEAEFDKQTIGEKFDALSIKSQGKLETQFADEQRQSMDQKFFRRLVYGVLNYSANDCHGELDGEWEAFLTRTLPDWRQEALENFADSHDWLNDQEEQAHKPENRVCNDPDGLG